MVLGDLRMHSSLLRMVRVIRALRWELLARRTTPSMVSLYALTIFGGSLTILTADPEGIITAWRFASLLTDGPLTIGALMVSVLAAVAVGAEFRFSTIGQAVCGLGNRSSLFLVKLGVNCGSAAVLTAIALAFNWILLSVWLGFSAPHFDRLGGGTVRLILTSILVGLLWAVVGSGLAFAVRSQAVSVGILIAYFGIGESLVGGFLSEDLAAWLPVKATRSAVKWSDPADFVPDPNLFASPRGYISALTPLVLMSIAALASGWISFTRRDI